MEGDHMFLSYHTFLRLIVCFISGYAIETRSLRDVGISFAQDTRVFHMIIRSLASPSICSFSQFGSSTLDLPKHWVMHIHTYTHHTLVLDYALDIQRLCILESGIPHKSNLLVYGFALDTRTPCILSLASLTNRFPSTTDYQTLGSRHRYLCPIGMLWEEDSALFR